MNVTAGVKGALSVPLEDRFWEKVEKIPFHTCWEWTGARTSAGYGQIYRDGRLDYAHRVAYELSIGPIPDGMEIDHLCRNRGCVRPDHLEPVSHFENSVRGGSKNMTLFRAEVCGRGHRRVPGDGRCRPCLSLKGKRRRAALEKARGEG